MLGTSSQRAISVQHVDLNVKCWVVRPGIKYRYFADFLERNMVATAHLDRLSPDQIDFNDEINHENINQKVDGLDTIGSRNIHTQIENFLIDMQVGDVVFTLSGDMVVPGVIVSSAYFERECLGNNEGFHVRRRVTWGEPVRRREIPLALQKSFTAYQTVFSLGGKSEEVLHWLMSFFITDNIFCTSLRVEQAEAIRHHTLKQLAELVDRVQVLALLIGEEFDGEYTNEVVQFEMERLSNNGELSLTAQQMLMSPGDVWLQFKTNNRKAGIAFMLIMGAIFNHDVAFASTVDNRISEELRSHIEGKKEVAMDGLNFDRVSQVLELRLKRQNRGFVSARPTNREIGQGINFPEDGDARHASD